MKTNYSLLRCLTVVGLLYTSTLWSAQYQFGVNTSVATSDNVTQTPGGPEGNIFELGLIFNVETEEIPNWEFSLDSEIARLHYSIDNLVDEDRKSIAGQTNWTPDASNFALTLFGNVSQAPANRFQTEEVNNLVDSEIYAVAPSYFFRLSPVTRLNFNYQHADYYIEQNEQTRNLQSGPRLEQQLTVSLDRTLNTTNTLSFVVQKRDTDFEDDTRENFTDYIQESAFIRWIVNNRANQMNIEAGKYRVEDFRNREVSESQWTFLFNRRINRNQNINFQFFRRVSSLFSVNPVTGEISVNQQNNAINQAEESRGSGALYNYNDGHLNVNVAYFENKLEGLFEPTLETRESVSTRLSYDLSKSFQTPLDRNIVFFLSRIDSEFDTALTNSSGNRVDQASVIYEHFISPRLMLSFSYDYRDATQAFIDSPNRIVESETFLIRLEFLDQGRF